MSFVTILDPDTKVCQHVCRALSSTERINRCLKHSSYTALRAVNCDTVRGCFVLGGSVPNFYLKQLAQEMAGKVVGLEKIENHIRVKTGATNR
jgi:osmotically-inducible protein OsmY